MAVDYFGYFGITKGVNSMPIYSQGRTLFLLLGEYKFNFLI